MTVKYDIRLVDALGTMLSLSKRWKTISLVSLNQAEPLQKFQTHVSASLQLVLFAIARDI